MYDKRYRLVSGDQLVPKDSKNNKAEDRPNACYLIVTVDGRIVPIKAHKLWSIWTGQGTLDGLPVRPEDDLTVLTVIRRGLEPACAYVMRLVAKNKRIDRNSISAVCEDAIALNPENWRKKPQSTKRRARKKIAWHKEMLPKDASKQLAVYCDAPAYHFEEIDVGGPLPLSTRCRMSIDECLNHLLDENE